MRYTFQLNCPGSKECIRIALIRLISDYLKVSVFSEKIRLALLLSTSSNSSLPGTNRNLSNLGIPPGYHRLMLTAPPRPNRDFEFSSNT